MPMPNRQVTGDYRYAYQGQEKDRETGMEAFQLRLYDARIGRWLVPDPKSEFFSPYLAMGNNPIVYIDPDGGMTSGGGCPDPPCDGAGNVMLDEVLITTHSPGSSGWSDFLNGAADYAMKTGQHILVMGGASVNAFASDLAFGAGRMDANAFDNSEFGTSFRLGQIIGDVAAMAAGGAEIEAGIGLGAGGVLAVPATGGLSLAGTAAGVGLAAHGSGVVLTGGANAAAGIAGLVNHMSKRGNHNAGKGKPRMGNNGAKNEEVISLVKKYKLSRENQRKLHDYITGEGYSRSRIEKIIKTGEYLYK